MFDYFSPPLASNLPPAGTRDNPEYELLLKMVDVPRLRSSRCLPDTPRLPHPLRSELPVIPIH